MSLSNISSIHSYVHRPPYIFIYQLQMLHSFERCAFETERS
jgi:hypothetical protein